ncbi:hypothetical protein PV-S19_0354 [Pacmanvirus S19]|nr:hypothetical protein PV-S19_0354 [Pacmanvirus S19]
MIKINENRLSSLLKTSKICNGYIYITSAPTLEGIKIGKAETKKGIRKRYITLAGRNIIVTTFKSTYIQLVEEIIHQLLKEYHISGELFKLECFDKAVLLCKEITNSLPKTKIFIDRKSKKNTKSVVKIKGHITRTDDIIIWYLLLIYNKLPEFKTGITQYKIIQLYKSFIKWKAIRGYQKIYTIEKFKNNLHKFVPNKYYIFPQTECMKRIEEYLKHTIFGAEIKIVDTVLSELTKEDMNLFWDNKLLLNKIIPPSS